MIELRNLSWRIDGVDILSDISCALPQGQITAILGPNGAGKSSLIKLIAGLLRPTRGQVLLDGQDVIALSPRDRARKMGYLAQNAMSAWSISVAELVALGRMPHHQRLQSTQFEDKALVRAAMQACRIEELATRGVNSLSGGELSRALIARVLAGQPDWILADEPLANLDPAYERDTLQLLRDSRTEGRGVITILHQINAAAAIADHVILLKAGRLLAAGPSQDILTAETLSATYEVPFTEIKRDGGSYFMTKN